MADRLTQLQDTINQQAEHFCNSVGILQQFSSPAKFPGFDRVGSVQQNQSHDQDYASLFASLVARCAKDIDIMIDSLPSEESSQELQIASLIRLEQENTQAFEQLEEIVRHGEALLERIQAALQDIAQSQLDMQNPIGNTVSSPELDQPCEMKEENIEETVDCAVDVPTDPVFETEETSVVE